MKKYIGFFLILAFFFLVYLLRFNFLRQQVYFYRLPDYRESDFAQLTAQEAVLIGPAHNLTNCPPTSYLHYTRQKPSGTVRVGIFGCSIVAGDETANGHDFPSLLQAKLKKEGFNNFEIINFGLTARGIHQMFILWEKIGKKYDLDYVVFLSFSCHKHRDNGFTWSNFCFPPVYARYILDKGKVKLIPPSGKSPLEAYKSYHRLMPPWRYIRYDNRMPMFLRALLPFSLQARLNPFYYKLQLSPKNKQEIMQTYEILFNKLTKETKNLIIIANDEEIFSLKERVQGKNVHFIQSQIPFLVNSFLYVSPLGHNSALGNQMRADELFNFLTNKEDSGLIAIDLSRLKEESIPGELIISKPLFEYKDISVYIDNLPASKFIIYQWLPPSGIKYQDLDFQKQKISSLLLLPNSLEDSHLLAPALMLKQNNLEAAKFAPLPFLLNDNAAVFLSFKVNKEAVSFPIGKVRAMANTVGELILDLNADGVLERRGRNWQVILTNTKISVTARGKIGDIFINIGNEKALKIAKKTALNRKLLEGEITSLFKPLHYEYAYLRAKAGDFPNPQNKGNDGTLDLVARDEKEASLRFPIFCYRRRGGF